MNASDDPPPAFTRLGSCFLQDDFRWGRDNFSAWAARAIDLTHLPPDQIEALKAYIDGILADPDDEAVDRAWHSMGAAFGVRGGGRSRKLFRIVRGLLDTVRIQS